MKKTPTTTSAGVVDAIGGKNEPLLFGEQAWRKPGSPKGLYVDQIDVNPDESSVSII